MGFARTSYKASACLLSSMFLGLPGLTPAAEEVHEYNPLVITASPIARPLMETNQSMSVITRAEIQQLPVDNLADVLDFLGGLDVRQRGGRGVQADIGIRGTAYEQTLIMVNGIRMTDPQTGHHNMNLPIPLAHIERIEILKGPGSAAYGPNATGGAINIITRRPDQNEAGVALAGGSYNYQSLSASAGTGGGGRGDHLLSFSRRTSDGHIDDEPTDFELTSANYTGHTDLGQHHLSWGLGVDDREFGAFKFYTADFPDQREETRTLLGYINGEFALGGLTLTPGVFWRNHEDWFRTRDQAFVDDFGLPSDTIINEHETDVIGTRIGGQTAWRGGITSIGVSYTDESMESSALGDHDRHESSAWLEHNFSPVARLNIGLSGAVVDYSDYGSEFLPGLSLSWQASGEVTAFASVARSTRIPSYTELFLQTGGNLGNPELEPETSDYSEIGARFTRGNQSVTTALFYRSTSNLIDWSRDPGDVQWQADNFDGHRTRGGEVELSLRSPDAGALAMTRIAFTRLSTELDDRGQEIKYALDYPQQQASLTLLFNWLPQLDHSIQTRYTERRDGQTVTLLGTRLGWQQRNIRYTLEGNNLLDREYTEAGFAPLPGRWVIGGIEVDF